MWCKSSSGLSLALLCLRICGDAQPEHLQPLSMQDLSPGLRPLVLWMANSIELLHFVQHDVPQLLPWRQDQEDKGGHFAVAPPRWRRVECVFFQMYVYACVFSGVLDAEMSSTRTACEEAMTVLEEVIMFTFQQSVYYLTKVSAATQNRCTHTLINFASFFDPVKI